ncbi:MAG: hypothetical protein ACREVE_13735 [Gammaproteobacteria bacterium]
MISPVMLWIDLTQRASNPGTPIIGSPVCRVHRVFGGRGLDEVIRSVQPRALCFEFDYPLSADLAMLSETKRSHPSVPILMLAEPHAETLAIWALRARVWDYFVKPVSEAEILRSIMPLFRKEDYKHWDRRAPRDFIAPAHDIPDRPSPLSLSRTQTAILRAHAYIESHLWKSSRRGRWRNSAV